MTPTEVAALVLFMLAGVVAASAFGLMMNGWRGVLGFWLLLLFTLGGIVVGGLVASRFDLLKPKSATEGKPRPE